MKPNSHLWTEKEIEKINKSLKNSRFGPVQYVNETGSTNTDLLEQISRGIPEGTVLVTDYQKKGRGRLGRHWEAPPGKNLLFSVFLYPKMNLEKVSLTTPGLALALVDALEKYGLSAGIKWPNDVYLTDNHSGKVAGILAEVADTEIPAVVIGMGCNVAWPEAMNPELPDAVSILATGNKIQRSELLVNVLLGFEKYLLLLEQPNGQSEFREIHLKKSITIGKNVRVHQPIGEISGLAIDVDAAGTLILENNRGLHQIFAGDVTHAHIEAEESKN
tara:strand:+ start:1307 stop:2131 length:825 start_codon:yes stop_codon:yes gene_type:complete